MFFATAGGRRSPEAGVVRPEAAPYLGQKWQKIPSVSPDGSYVSADGSYVSADGSYVSADGAYVSADGAYVSPLWGFSWALVGCSEGCLLRTSRPKLLGLGVGSQDGS